jgi:hypothetical protein
VDSKITKQQIGHQVTNNIIVRSINKVIYAFVFIALFLAIIYQFQNPQIKYLIPFLILTLFIYLLKKPFWGILTLVIFLPFHAFLVMLTRHCFALTGDQVFCVAFWKELFIILLLVVVLTKSLWKKKLPFKLISLDWLILILAALGVLSVLYGTRNFNQALWGLRTDFEFFIVYFLARSIIKNKNQLKILVASVLGTGLLVILFAILQIYYWPADFLVRFGYILLPWVPGGPLQAYQTVGNLIRIISTFSGAIQLGPYLAILILLSLSLLLFIKSKIIKVFLGLFSILCLFPLYHTFTRSAWLGLLVGLFILFLIIVQDRFKKISASSKSPHQKFWCRGKKVISIVLVTVFLVGLILGTFFLLKSAAPSGPTYFDELIYHRASTYEHWQSITESLKIIKNHPFGLGLGKSGLVTLRFDQRFLSENWYLQIATEMGILALAVFIGIMVIFIRSTYRLYLKAQDPFIKALSLGVLLSFICFSIVGLFLHAWGDNTVVALTFWILAGGILEYQVLQTKTK